ncbi:MAG TPA: SRPBCC family protein [Polyangiales bacterium]|nr:SRPBCC family protein [Polyangiales bacterium]
MSNTLEVRHVSVSIERTPDDVYRFASNLETWSEWAAGLGKSIRREGRDWIANGPLGEVRVRLAEPNPFRVLDHDVTLPTGVSVQNPFRVLPNGAGSEVVFSVFRQPGTSDQEFQADTSAVEKDLRALKQLLERS